MHVALATLGKWLLLAKANQMHVAPANNQIFVPIQHYFGQIIYICACNIPWSKS
jgi:hypothetical protein